MLLYHRGELSLGCRHDRRFMWLLKHHVLIIYQIDLPDQVLRAVFKIVPLPPTHKKCYTHYYIIEYT